MVVKEMMDFSQRFIDIVQILSKKHSYMTLQELSDVLQVSPKTVSRTMKLYMKETSKCKEQGFSIVSKQGYGFQIIIKDKQKFKIFASLYFSEIAEVKEEKVLREKQLLQILLMQNKYITIQELADKVYISESTAATALKNVRHILQRYGLELKNKPSVGIKIAGNEMSIRLCYANYVMNSKEFTNHLHYTHEDIQFVENIILEVLLKWQVQIADLGREHLVSHILVSLYRMKEGFLITFDKAEKEGIMQTKEYHIAEDILRLLKKRYKIIDFEEEIIYITIQLLGKRTLSLGKDELILSDDIEQILLKIFDQIKIRFAVDLNADDTVFNYLALHFEPMLTRLKYGIKSNNPLMEEVKNQHPTSFEMGLIAKQIIMDNYQYVLDDNEVSYLAMYFSLALDQLKYLKKPKNILIVCGLGVCSSRILIYKLRQQYGQYINDIVTCQFHELKHISLRSFDCIISTINQPIGTTKPVIYIDNFLDDLKDKELENFFLDNQGTNFKINDYLKEEYFYFVDTMENEEEAIDYILSQIKRVTEIPNELKQNIMEREKLSSTAFGNYCALPHPIKMCTSETLFAVLILNKPMQWSAKKVRYIFLLSPSKYQPEDLRNFNDHLAKVILDTKSFSKFSRNPNFETLRSLFMTI